MTNRSDLALTLAGASILALLFGGAAIAGKPGSPLTGLQIYSAGTSIGWLLDDATATDIWVLSAKGYAFQLDRDLGRVRYEGDVRFSGTGCTGQAYINVGTYPTLLNLLRQGVVFFNGFNSSNGYGVYYIPRSYTPFSGNTYSKFVAIFGTVTGGYCAEEASYSGGLVEVLPNDPAITGVQSTPYSPLRIGIP